MKLKQEQPPLAGNRTGNTAKLRAMKVGTNELFVNAKVNNLSALCHRIEKGGFVCRTEGKNVRVWRLRRGHSS